MPKTKTKTISNRCMDLKEYDNYFTPKWVWGKISHLIPKTTVIWEACMLDATKSSSMEDLRSLGFSVVGDVSWDIFTCPVPECDIIVTNPPFSLKYAVMARLLEIGKPFIVIINSINLFTVDFHSVFWGKTEDIQLLIPDEKLHYRKDGEEEQKQTTFCSVYLAYKMNIDKNSLFLSRKIKKKWKYLHKPCLFVSNCHVLLLLLLFVPCLLVFSFS